MKWIKWSGEEDYINDSSVESECSVGGCCASATGPGAVPRRKYGRVSGAVDAAMAAAPPGTNIGFTIPLSYVIINKDNYQVI